MPIVKIKKGPNGTNIANNAVKPASVEEETLTPEPTVEDAAPFVEDLPEDHYEGLDEKIAHQNALKAAKLLEETKAKQAKAAKPAVHKEELKQVVGSVETQHPDGSTETTEEILGEGVFTEQTAEITVSMGLTKNLGNYESLKFQVSIKMPCRMDAEDIEETYAQAKEWVDDKVNAINQEVDEQLA